MNHAEKFNAFAAKCPIVSILRGITLPEVADVCDALYDSGIYMLEITLNTPGALEMIRTAVVHCGERQLVGAGTVLSAQEVRDVAAVGASLVISPNVDVEVIRETARQGLVSMPGFYTPSEAFQAIAAGADYLKLFPAGAAGIGYVKDIKAVVKKPIFAVGGVTTDNISDFLDVCAGAGIGSALYKPGRSPDEIRRLAQIFARAATR